LINSNRPPNILTPIPVSRGIGPDWQFDRHQTSLYASPLVLLIILG
jgi:hypothetical protein